MVHFGISLSANQQSSVHKKLKATTVPTVFTLERGHVSYGKTQKSSNVTNQQRMTFVQTRIDEVRDTFRGRQTSTRGRRRGRPRKRLNDDLDEWTPDRPRAVRGRKRGRPPASSGRGRPPASLSPVRKAPRGRGRVANDRSRPGPKPKLEGPGPPPAVITPGGKCFVCSKAAGSTGSSLTALTSTTKMQLHQKLGRVVGAELDLIVDEDGVLCHGCCRLLNYMDRIEVEHSMLTKSILNCMRRTFGFGYVQGDNRMPEAVLASIEDYSKNSMIPVEKLGLSLEMPEKDTSDAMQRSKTVAPVSEADKKNQILSEGVPETKTESENDKKNYLCKICNFKSKHKSVFLFHLRRHLQDSYRCDFCNTLLPKGFKMSDAKNSETSCREALGNKNGSLSVTETVEVPATKEVKDYVETMIEELHTTGIVTTMKPVTPEKVKSSLEARSDIKKTGHTVIQNETKATDVSYRQQNQTSVQQGTLNILLTFPNEKRESVSVRHNVPVVEHNFSNDAVARELRDIFGNFNDEPLDTEDQTDVPDKDDLNTAYERTLSEAPLLENSPVSIGSKNGDYKQQNEVRELSNEASDSVMCEEDLDIKHGHISTTDDTEEKYQKQLALLDEMGLIMLPKRNRTFAHKHNSETEMKQTYITEQEKKGEHWADIDHIESSTQPTQEHESGGSQECELETLKEQGNWLPESLDGVAESTNTTVTNVTVLAESDSQLQSASNGSEWLKSTVSLVEENAHWLHQADSNTTADGSSEMTAWPDSASHSGQPETLAATEPERNWLLPGSHISEPTSTNVKDSETEHADSSGNVPVWCPTPNSTMSNSDNIFRRSDDVECIVNSDSSASIRNEGGSSSTHIVAITEIDNNESCFEADKASVTSDNEQCVSVDRQELTDTLASWSSDPVVESANGESSSVHDGNESTDILVDQSKVNDVVIVTNLCEASAQEPLSVMLVDSHSECVPVSSEQMAETSNLVCAEDYASVDSSEVKQFDFQRSETEMSSETVSAGSSEIETSNVIVCVDDTGTAMNSVAVCVGNSETQSSSFVADRIDLNSLKEKEVNGADNMNMLVEQSEYSERSDNMKIGQKEDTSENSVEPNLKSIER